MPMVREDHENLLNELNDPTLDVVRRTEVLQLLRTDYGAVITDHTTTTERLQETTKLNEDLTIANSKLFRQLGVQDDPSLKQKEDKKEFSETVSLESLGL